MSTNFKHLATLYILIGLLLLTIFLQRSCDSNIITPKNTTIVIPAKGGTFVKTKSNEIKYDTIIKDTIIYKDKKIIIDNTDKTIVEKYLKATDSIGKLKILIDAVKIRRYSDTFDNDDIKLTIETETVGKLNWIKPTYTIKEKTITVPEKTKETVFAMYGGIEIYNNLQLSNPGVKVDLGIQNKKGDIFTGGYDMNQNIYIGFKKQIFNIKK